MLFVRDIIIYITQCNHLCVLHWRYSYYITYKYLWKLVEINIPQSCPISQGCSMNRTSVSPCCSWSSHPGRAEKHINTDHRVWDTCQFDFPFAANIKGSTINRTIILIFRIMSRTVYWFSREQNCTRQRRTVRDEKKEEKNLTWGLTGKILSTSLLYLGRKAAQHQQQPS